MKAPAASDILTRENNTEVMKDLMKRIRRCLAGLLAGIMLFPGTSAVAEGTDETVKIQESLVSREEKEETSLRDHLLQIAELMNREEVRNLLSIDDVKSIVNDVLVKVLHWMIDNRPVTMKIFTELGIGEKDRECIAKLWDSAERIEKASQAYQTSEEGKQLHEEFAALMEDPDILDSLGFLQTLFSRENVDLVMQAVRNSINSGVDNSYGNGPLTREAREKELDQKSFVGFLLVLMLGVMEQSDQVQVLIPRLLENQHLWAFLAHVSEAGRNINPILQEEFKNLADDPDITGFFERASDGLHMVMEEYNGIADNAGKESDKQRETEEDVP